MTKSVGTPRILRFARDDRAGSAPTGTATQNTQQRRTQGLDAIGAIGYNRR